MSDHAIQLANGQYAVPAGRLFSIAYHCVGVQTEGGPVPYTAVANAGGASGLSLGIAQNDFKQNPHTAAPYARAVMDWQAAEGNLLPFTQAQFTVALTSASLTPEMRAAARGFGGNDVGAQWIHDNLDVPHLNAAVQAAERAFATPYGQAVLAQGTHVEEFASFAMKIYNQYGPGQQRPIDAAPSPGFRAFMAYLEDGGVVLRDNRNGGTVAVVAGRPGEFNASDLQTFAEQYRDTRSVFNEAVSKGPMAAFNSGALYREILDSDTTLSDALLRAESKGDFSPVRVDVDPDAAVTRALFGAGTNAVREAVAAINDATTVDPIRVNASLGQYPATIWIDPMTERVAVSYRDTTGGYVMDRGGYYDFDQSAVVRVDGVRTLRVQKDGQGVSFDVVATPTANTGTVAADSSTPLIDRLDSATASDSSGLSPVTRHGDESALNAYTFTTTITQATEPGARIQQGDQVTIVYGASGQIEYESIRRVDPSGTDIVTEIIVGADGNWQSGVSIWQEGQQTQRFTFDGQGTLVGESYIAGGVTYYRAEGQDRVRWEDPNGRTPAEREAQGIASSDARFTPAPSAEPIASSNGDPPPSQITNFIAVPTIEGIDALLGGPLPLFGPGVQIAQLGSGGMEFVAPLLAPSPMPNPSGASGMKAVNGADLQSDQARPGISLGTRMANGDVLFRLSDVPGAEVNQLHIDIINSSPTAVAAFEWAVANNIPVTIRPGEATYFDPEANPALNAPNGMVVLGAARFSSITHNASADQNTVANAVTVVALGLHEISHGRNNLDGTPLRHPATFSNPSDYAVARAESEGNSLSVEGRFDAEMQGQSFTPAGSSTAVTIDRDTYLVGTAAFDRRLHSINSDPTLPLAARDTIASTEGALHNLDQIASTVNSTYLNQGLVDYAAYWSGVPAAQITGVQVDDSGQSWSVSTRTGGTEVTISYGTIDTSRPNGTGVAQALSRVETTVDDDGNRMITAVNYGAGSQATTAYDPAGNVVATVQTPITTATTTAPTPAGGVVEAPAPAQPTPAPYPIYAGAPGTGGTSTDAGPNGSDLPAPAGSSGDPDFYNDDYVYTPTPTDWNAVTQGVSLIQLVMGLNNWQDMSDLQRAAAAVGVYQGIAGLSRGELPALPTGVTGALGLLVALDSGDPLAIAQGAANFSGQMVGAYANSMADGIRAGVSAGVIDNGLAINMLDQSSNLAGMAQGLGAFASVIGLVMAFESGDPYAMVSSSISLLVAVQAIPVWGQIIAVFVALAGTFQDEPTVEGTASAVWDDSGQLASTITHEAEGGGQSAQGAMDSLLNGMQTAMAQLTDADGNALYAINPARMPQVGYRYDPDGTNYGMQDAASLSLTWTDENGQAVTRYYDAQGNRGDGTGDNIAQDFAQHAQAALVPAWLLETARPEYQQHIDAALADEAQLAELRVEAAAIAPQMRNDGSGAEGGNNYLEPSLEPERYEALQAQITRFEASASNARQQAQSTLAGLPSVAELGQQAVVSGDGNQQSLSAITLTLAEIELPANIAPRQVLTNLDADVYLERTDWVAANQALLGIDLNGDGRIAATELLTGNLDWLDANHDGRIDASDPAFGALRLWADINGDGQSLKPELDADGQPIKDEKGNIVYESEARGLGAAGITAIDFSGGRITVERADGTSQEAGEHTLSGDTRGVLYSAATGGAHGVIQTTEQQDGSGASVLLAANTRQFDGHAAHTHGGEVAGGQAPQGTSVDTGDARLRSTSSHTVASTTVQTVTTLGVGDARMGQGAQGQALDGQNPGQSATTATAAQVVSHAAPAASEPEPTQAPAAPRETVVVRGPEVPAQAYAPQEPVGPAPSPVVLSGQEAIAQAQAVAGIEVDGLPGHVLSGQIAGQQPAQTATNVQSNGQRFIAESASVQPVVVEAGSERITSHAQTEAARQLRERQERNARGDLRQPIAFIPIDGSPAQQRQEVTTAMVRSADGGLFGAGGGLMALALGAGAAQAGTAVSAGAFTGFIEPNQLTVHAPWAQSAIETGAVLASEAAGAAAGGASEAASERGVVFRQVDLGSLRASSVEGEGSSSPAGASTNANANPNAASAPTYTATVATQWASMPAGGGVAGASSGNSGASASSGTPGGSAQGSGGAAGGTPAEGGSSSQAGASTSTATQQPIVLEPPRVQDTQLIGREDVGLVMDLGLLLPAGSLEKGASHTAQQLNLTSVGAPSHGRVSLQTVTGADGNAVTQIVFIPDANYFGPASFSYTVTDAYGQQAAATATLDIQGVNDAPEAVDEATTSREDEALLIDPVQLLANDSDIDDAHERLAITAVGDAQHGTVRLEGGRIVFQPEANYHGPASFSYTVTDAEGASSQATAHVDIVAANDAPVARGEELDSQEDEGLVFSAATLLHNDSDADGDSLRIARVGEATHGTVVLDAQGQVCFIPQPNYSGPASFGYWIADPSGAESFATVRITIAPVNDGPSVTGEIFSGAEDTVYSFDPALLLANDSDIDGGDALSIAGVGAAQHGQVALVNVAGGGQRIVFTPAANYFGAASFQYTVSDGAGGTSQGTVVLNLAEVNDTPVAMPDQQGGLEDTALHIPVSQLLGNDTDPDTANSSFQPGAANDVLTIAGVGAVGNAVHGTVALGVDPATQAPEIVFTPDADYFGPASFTYTVQDGRGASASTLVTLTIAPVNDAPVVVGESVASDEDTPLLIAPAALLVNDLDIDNPHADLRVSAVGAATHGTVALQPNGTIAFTPEADYFGTASFEYAVSDGSGGHTVAVATVQLANVNDAPRLLGETVSGTEDTPLDIAAARLLANDTDIDSPHANLAITSVGSATNGSVVLQADGSIRFTPNTDYNSAQGPASFEYTVADGDGGVTTGVATLDIAAVNDAPVVLGEIASAADEDTVLTFTPAALLANDTDVDNLPNELSVSAVGNAVHGSVALAADGSVTFTPELNHNGAASFSYTVSDGAGGSAQATVTLQFTPVNDAPTLANDTVAAVEDTAILLSTASLLTNDLDVDTPHAQLAVTAVGGAAHGTVVLEAGGNIRFTPDADFNGAASFSYTVSDGAGGVSTATAQVQVGAVNDDPAAQNDTLAQQLEDTNLVILASALLGNDTDVDIATNGQVLLIVSVSAIAGQTHGTVALDAGGNVLFSPDANYAGPVRFGYAMDDGYGGQASATAGFDLANVNDAPVVAGELYSAKNQSSIVIQQASLLANDSDPDTPFTGDVLSVTGVSAAQNGAAVLQSDGSVLFTPDAGFAGVAQFSYEVSDGHGGVTSAIAQVNTVNLAPVAVGEAVAIQEDSVTTIGSALLLANDTDPDNLHSELRISAVSGATHGTVTLNGSGDVVFAPDANYFGVAQFSYTVADGDGGQATATASLNIQSVNDAPQVTGETASLQEDQVAVFSVAALLVNDTDIETPQNLGITAVGNASGGSVQLAGGQVVFTPWANYAGPASFSYTVSDGQGGFSQAPVSLYFAPVNDAPVANSESFSGLQDTTYTFSYGALLANDTDAESPSYLAISQVWGSQNGVATLTGAGVEFTPTPGFVGTASFNYTVTDPEGAFAYATAYVNLQRANHNPTAVDDSFSGLEDLPFQIGVGQLLANDFDSDTPYNGDQLGVVSVGGASNGSVSLTAGSHVTFVPTPEYGGAAQFSYVVSDGKGGTTTATAYLTVNAVNDAPVFDGVYYDPNPDSGVWTPGDQAHDPEYLIADIPGQQNGTVYAHDIDSPGGLTFSLAQGPTHGHASVGADGSWLYQSEAVDPYRGSDPFWVRATDSGGASAVMQVAATHDHMTPVPIIGGGGSGGGGGDPGGGGPGNGSEPIVIDLQGDGLHLIAPEQSTMRLDTDGDGRTEQIGWAAPEEAVLAYDANRSGHVDGLQEIRFTDYLPGAKTDLEGLRAFDSNGDGKLDALDEKWAGFGLLQTPQGAVSLQQGTFTPLTATPVTSIGLERQGQPMVNNGSIVYGTSPVALADGGLLQASDVRFTALPLPASDAEIARMALTLNSWANASTPVLDSPLTFVPAGANGVEVTLDPALALLQAANATTAAPAPLALVG